MRAYCLCSLDTWDPLSRFWCRRCIVGIVIAKCHHRHHHRHHLGALIRVIHPHPHSCSSSLSHAPPFCPPLCPRCELMYGLYADMCKYIVVLVGVIIIVIMFDCQSELLAVLQKRAEPRYVLQTVAGCNADSVICIVLLRENYAAALDCCTTLFWEIAWIGVSIKSCITSNKWQS